MAALIKKLWSFVGAYCQIGIVLAAIAAVGGGFYFVYHEIDKAGYDRAMSDVAAVAKKRDEEAAKEIAKIEEKYDKILQTNRKDKNYLSPVSPIVGAAIARMPPPQPRAK